MSPVVLRSEDVAPYHDGVLDGMEAVFLILIGDGTVDVADPCPEPVPPHIQDWARRALARIPNRKGTE